MRRNLPKEKNVLKRIRSRYNALADFLNVANIHLAMDVDNPDTYDLDAVVKDVVVGIVASQDNGVLKLVMVGPQAGSYPELIVLAMDRLRRRFREVHPGMHPATTEWYNVATSTYGYPYHAIAFRCNGQWVKSARIVGGATLMSKEDAKRWARVFKQLTGSS